MKKMNPENMIVANVILAAVFLLLVAAAGQLPSPSGPDRPQAQQVANKSETMPAVALLQGEHCSLADFDQLTHNIRSLRRGMSARKATELAKYIWQAGARFNCDPKLVAALIQVESSFFSRARSHKGAMGLMQLRPFVARDLAHRLETSWNGPQVLHDPETNILMGTYYLATLIRDFPDLATALAAYNCGPTYVRRCLRHGQRLPTKYSVKVMSLYQTFAANQS